MSTVFEHRGTVRWSETDASGLFHYVAALVWAEEAEHALCRSLDSAWSPHGMPRRAISATFHAPFEAGDNYTLKLWVAKLGTTSIGYAWAAYKGDALAVEGSHTAVRLGPDKRPEPMPAVLRDGLGRYLKGPANV